MSLYLKLTSCRQYMWVMFYNAFCQSGFWLVYLDPFHPLRLESAILFFVSCLCLLFIYLFSFSCLHKVCLNVFLESFFLHLEFLCLCSVNFSRFSLDITLYIHNLLSAHILILPIWVKYRNFTSLFISLTSSIYNCLKYIFYIHLETHQCYFCFNCHI